MLLSKVYRKGGRFYRRNGTNDISLLYRCCLTDSSSCRRKSGGNVTKNRNKKKKKWSTERERREMFLADSDSGAEGMSNDGGSKHIMKGLNFLRPLGDKESDFNYIRFGGFHNFFTVEDALELFKDFNVSEEDIVRQYYNINDRGSGDLKPTGVWFVRVQKEHFLKIFDHRNSVGCFTGLTNLLKIHEKDWNAAKKINVDLFGGHEDKCVVVDNIPRIQHTGMQIRAFLSGFCINPGEVRVCARKSGSGDRDMAGFAIVPLHSKEEARRAVLEKHLTYFGNWRASVTLPAQIPVRQQYNWHQSPQKWVP